MRTSVGSEGGVMSPGRNCMKSLKTVADFQTSSSSFPSMTGAVSKRVSRVGFTFSGVSRAARRAAELPGAAFAFFAEPCAGAELVAAPFVGGLDEAPAGEAAGRGGRGGAVLGAGGAE